jgi:hypothetical protein
MQGRWWRRSPYFGAKGGRRGRVGQVGRVGQKENRTIGLLGRLGQNLKRKPFQNKNWIFEFTRALEIYTRRFRRNFDVEIFPNFF